MYFKKSIFLLIVLSMFGVIPASATATAECASLSRNLKVGMSGADVKVLQQILNVDPKTRIAEMGIGSSGQESMYFGVKTKLAVIKFQEKHAKEVLFPAGLTVGSGFIGAFSRAKLTTLCVASVPVVSSASSSTSRPPNSAISVQIRATATPSVIKIPILPPVSSFPTSTSKGAPAMDFAVTTFTSPTPVLMYPSAYSAPRGKEIKLYASGLAPTGNTVHLGRVAITDTRVDTWGMLTFTIPNDAPFGFHNLYVSSSKGHTNTSYLIVTNPAVLAPKIVDFSPKEGPIGTVVTLTGEGFVLMQNQIIGGQNPQAVAVPSGETTLKFTVKVVVPGLNVTSQDLPATTRIPVWYYLRNENGLTEPFVFTITR